MEKVISKKFSKRFFHDKNGKIVLTQFPNLPLIVWGSSRILLTVFTTGKTNQSLDLLSFGAIFTWAWLELFHGANYFRRLLGLIILVLTMYTKLN